MNARLSFWFGHLFFRWGLSKCTQTKYIHASHFQSYLGMAVLKEHNYSRLDETLCSGWKNHRNQASGPKTWLNKKESFLKLNMEPIDPLSLHKTCAQNVRTKITKRFKAQTVLLLFNIRYKITRPRFDCIHLQFSNKLLFMPTFRLFTF